MKLKALKLNVPEMKVVRGGNRNPWGWGDWDPMNSGCFASWVDDSNWWMGECDSGKPCSTPFGPGTCGTYGGSPCGCVCAAGGGVY